MWLLPDGTPWKIEILSGTQDDNQTSDSRNCFAAVQQWKKFGIDAKIYHTEARADLNRTGDFDVSRRLAAQEPWGAGPDLYRTLDPWNSMYVKPIGERPAAGHPGRWSSPEMDAVIAAVARDRPRRL